MQLNQKAFALASAKVFSLLFVLCAAFVALWPEAITRFAGWWIHADLTDFISMRQVTLSSFAGGLIFSFAAAFAMGWVFAVVYNRLVDKAASTK